jgi:hypothetical protein
MAKPKAERQMAELGVFVHGVLASFHLLGLVYNVRRKNWPETVAHSAALTFDAYAVRKHIRQVRDQRVIQCAVPCADCRYRHECGDAR